MYFLGELNVEKFSKLYQFSKTLFYYDYINLFGRRTLAEFESKLGNSENLITELTKIIKHFENAGDDFEKA